MTEVLVAGDFWRCRGPGPTVDDAVRTLIRSASHALVNLDGPVTDSPQGTGRTESCLTMSPCALELLAGAGFTAVTLANHPLVDGGLRGIEDTLRLARACGLRTVGASCDPADARGAARLRLSITGGTLTVLNYAESVQPVRADGAGVSTWDVLDAQGDVRAARADGDRVLVVLHGGVEYFPLPRPRLRKELRFLASNGADAIVMHHSHVPGAYEVWDGVPIFYGLGNFVVTRPSAHQAWFEGLAVGLSFPTGATATFTISPLRQSRRFDVALATSAEAQESLNELEGYRIQVSSDRALEARWQEHVGSVRGEPVRCDSARGVRGRCP